MTARKHRVGRLGLAGAMALLLAACATQPPLEARLQAWIGRSETDLVTNFGVPAGTYAVGGQKFLQFDQWRTQLVPGSAWYGGPFYGRYGGFWQPAPPTAVVIGCSITFSLRQGVVEGFSFRGDGCR